MGNERNVLKMKSKRKKKALAPISLHPLTPEKAIADVFKIDPKKMRLVERRKRAKK
jgi:hypothetical protein